VHLLLSSRCSIVAQPNRQVLLCIIRSLTLCSKRTSVSTSWSGQILSDLQWYPFCICIQPLVDFLRGSRYCSFGFPKQYQSSLGYTCLQSLFSSLPLFGPSFDWDHSWLSTPLSFQLAIWLSSTAPTFNTHMVCYRSTNAGISILRSSYLCIHGSMDPGLSILRSSYICIHRSSDSSSSTYLDLWILVSLHPWILGSQYPYIYGSTDAGISILGSRISASMNPHILLSPHPQIHGFWTVHPWIFVSQDGWQCFGKVMAEFFLKLFVRNF